MSSILAHLQQQLADIPASTLWVGLSGGVDSCVLLHALTQVVTNKKIIAVHVNHQLQPQATAWQHFCAELCQQWQVTFCTETVSIQPRARHSIEALAREARYQAITQLMHPSDYLLTAHHLDDQIETFFLRLKRGSGPKGLSSMSVLSPLYEYYYLFRPLLSFSKQQLHAYAEAQQLVWIEDSSNQDTQFDRNYLRQQVLPLLTQRWPQFSQTVQRSVQLISEQEQLLESLLQEQLLSITTSSQQLMIPPLLVYERLKQQAIIRLWLQQQQAVLPSHRVLQQIIDSILYARQDAHPIVRWGKQQVTRQQQQLCYSLIK